MDAMKMLEEFCAAEPAPPRDWLTAGRAKVTAAIDADGEARPRRGRRLGWPVPPRTTVAGGAAIAAVTAVAVALAVVPGHGGTTTPQPRAQTAAYVISHTEAALSAAATENPVVHLHSPHINGGYVDGITKLGTHPEDTWYYGLYGTERTEDLTAAGEPAADNGLTETSTTATTVSADYRARIWWQLVQHGPAGTPTPPSARSCSDVLNFAITMYPTEWATDIRTALGCGQFTTSGTERVGGVNAIKLIPVRPGIMATVLWVDPSTYLPVRVAIEMRRSPSSPLGLNQIEDVQWLPPTAANLAKLTVPIPPGFVRVPPPPGPGLVCPGVPRHLTSAEMNSAKIVSALKKCAAAQNQAYRAWYAKYVAPRL